MSSEYYDAYESSSESDFEWGGRHNFRMGTLVEPDSPTYKLFNEFVGDLSPHTGHLFTLYYQNMKRFITAESGQLLYNELETICNRLGYFPEVLFLCETHNRGQLPSIPEYRLLFCMIKHWGLAVYVRVDIRDSTYKVNVLKDISDINLIGGEQITIVIEIRGSMHNVSNSQSRRGKKRRRGGDIVREKIQFHIQFTATLVYAPPDVKMSSQFFDSLSTILTLLSTHPRVS